ncbi:hypothetical protein CYMTET_4485 [Cymbomonas tetramitiformis]|uniref:Uncharacterized protein n=1 Tax=Cymbomonas tetramitiformis TaxID=36881 RepID=A0AAE0H1B0_9CHLO|nr:hypothetical protein CYMTET_4485 [Cymbomonas tetramitiformis]
MHLTFITAAILQVEPDAEVVGDRKNDYPIKVTVKKGDAVVWSGCQKQLFGKNGRPAQKDIVAALKNIYETYLLRINIYYNNPVINS